MFVQYSDSDVQIRQSWVVSKDLWIQGLTCSRLKVRVGCSPLKVSRHMIDTSFLSSCAGVNKAPNICSQAALMESYWHQTLARTSPPNSPAGARWRPAPPRSPLLHLDKSRGRMASRYRPRHGCAAHRWPPSGGFQCSLLSKDKLSNRLLFYEFTLRSISQKRLRKILGLSCSTLRQNYVLWKS